MFSQEDLWEMHGFHHPDNKWSLWCHMSFGFGRPVKGSVAHMTCCVNGHAPKSLS